MLRLPTGRPRRRARALLAALLGLAVQTAGPGAAGPVEDPAQALDPYGENLARWADRWRVDLGIEVRIVAKPLADHRLVRVARQQFDAHRLGANTDNGALLILIDTEGDRARIEVSRGLSALYPDELLGDLARHQLVTYASYGKLGMGVSDVLHWMLDHAYGQLAKASLADSTEAPHSSALTDWLARQSSRPAAEVDHPHLPDDLELKRRVPDRERARYAPSPLVTESVEAYVRVLDDLAGDPSLELFTPGSRVFRRRYPMAPYDAWKRRDRIAASKPWVVRVEGQRAVVDSTRPAHGFVPVLLHAIDGAWRIDLVERYKSLFFGPDGAPTLANLQNPYLFGLGHLRRVPRGGDLSALDLGGDDVVRRVAELETQVALEPRAETRFELAEILFRNCFAALDALAHYREAARLAPDDPEILRRTASRALYLDFPTIAIPLLERLGPEAYETLAAAHASAQNPERAEHFYQLALDRDPSSASARRGLAAARRAARR